MLVKKQRLFDNPLQDWLLQRKVKNIMMKNIMQNFIKKKVVEQIESNSDQEFETSEQNKTSYHTRRSHIESEKDNIFTKLKLLLKNGERKTEKVRELKSVYKHGTIRVKFSNNKNSALIMSGVNHLTREKLIVNGDKITQEDRIKNSNKDIVYPLFIVPCQNKLKVAWDAIMGLLVLYTSLVSPLDIAFEFENGQFRNFYVGFDYFLLCLFAMDILINFRTTYFDEQQAEIINSKLILKNYLRSYNFYVDLVSTIPISEIAEVSTGTKVNSTYSRVFKQFKLFRIFRLAKLTKFIQNENMKTMFQMLKLFFFFIIIFHWCTCIWHYIAKQDYNPNNIDDYTIWIPGTLRQLGPPLNSTLSLSQIYYEQISDFQRYSYCLYTLITLILGNDMGPTNVFQVTVGIFLSIGGQFLMSIFFGEVSVLVFKLNQQQTIYTEKLENLEQKIKLNKFPDYLKIRIIEYFDYCQQKKIANENQIDFSFFSPPLETQMHYYLKKDIIQGVPFFKELDSSEILWIIKSLRSEIYLPDDYIIRQGEMGDCMYFMTEGTVKVIVKNIETDDIELQFNLKKKSFFGEVALLTQSKRTSDVIAVDFCILENFTRESFLQLQKIFPEIQNRLQYGFSHYKIKSIETIVNILSKNPLFNEFKDSELKDIIKEFLELKFVDSNQLILKPKKQAFTWYLVLTGNVYKLTQSPNTQYLLRKMLVKKQDVSIVEYMQKADLFVEKNEDGQEEQSKDSSVQILKPGDYFGEIPFPDQNKSISHYYITQTGCQLITLTQDKLIEMKESWEYYYNTIYNNDKLKDRKVFQQSTLSKINERNNILISRTLKQAEFESVLEQFENIVVSQLNTLNTLNEKFSL